MRSSPTVSTSRFVKALFLTLICCVSIFLAVRPGHTANSPNDLALLDQKTASVRAICSLVRLFRSVWSILVCHQTQRQTLYAI
jgi:hypothetical protein